jgi:hypothetical protein
MKRSIGETKKGTYMRKFLALPIIVLLASSALADTSGDRLHEIEHFFENAKVISGPTRVDCKLSRGTETTCFSITVKAEPQNYTPGP